MPKFDNIVVVIVATTFSFTETVRILQLRLILDINLFSYLERLLYNLEIYLNNNIVLQKYNIF